MRYISRAHTLRERAIRAGPQRRRWLLFWLSFCWLPHPALQVGFTKVSKRVGASDGDLLIVTGQVEIGILSGFSSTLRYLNGNCSWRVTTILAGNEFDQPLSVGPQITLVGEDEGADDFNLKCVTEEGEKLNVIIITHCKEEWIISPYHELLSVISSGNYPTTIKYYSGL